MDAKDIRRIVLEQSKRAGVGHIGCALSIADIIAALYTDGLQTTEPTDPDRDRLILSKGHAALAVYAALHLRGWLTKGQLQTYCADASLLGVHPEHYLTGIDFSTGSLGQGLSFGVGGALAARMQHSSRRIFVVASDAELNEGSLWEAAMAAAHQHLGNLTLIVDVNGQQALGYTRDVLDLPNMAERWRAFGWDVHEIDGHDASAIGHLLAGLHAAPNAPHVLLAHTIFGKGVTFMERQVKWHYLPMNDVQYVDALTEVDVEVMR
jgi:transketolase